MAIVRREEKTHTLGKMSGGGLSRLVCVLLHLVENLRLKALEEQCITVINEL